MNAFNPDFTHKRHKWASGLTTIGHLHGWMWRWLQWHQAQCSWRFFHGIRSLQNMSRLGNLRRHCCFSNNSNKKTWVFTSSLFSRCLIHVLAYKHLQRPGMLMNRSLKLVVWLIFLWGVASLVCMPNVTTWNMLGEHSPRCHHTMWSVGLPWCWDMWNVGKGGRHWNYLDKCSRKLCSQTVVLLWVCWMPMPV